MSIERWRTTEGRLQAAQFAIEDLKGFRFSDAAIAQTAGMIQSGMDPITALTDLIKYQAGATESMRKALGETMMLAPRPLMRPPGS